jgi:hypothetical protein
MPAHQQYADPATVYAALRERGASRAVVVYSGGNDEGHADSIALFVGDSQIALLDEQLPYEWDPVAKRNVPVGTEAQKAEAALAAALCKPIYDRYGSFAGEFHVSGELIWNAVDERLEGESNETYESYESFDWD